MSAAIAAVEGNRQCIQAAQPAEKEEQQGGTPRSASESSERSVKVESPEDAGLKRRRFDMFKGFKWAGAFGARRILCLLIIGYNGL